MRRSEIYLKAAERMHEHIAHDYYGACDAIGDVDGDWRCYSNFDQLMRPQDVCCAWWGIYWPKRERKSCRTLALCFMAAIAADEEAQAKVIRAKKKPKRKGSTTKALRK